MTPDIRQLEPDDLAAWFASLGRAFFSSADPERLAEARRSTLEFDRCLAGFDGDRLVATFRSFPAQLTVPGGATVAADAVTGVTVSATHRRRGFLSAMMARDLAAARERGEPVAILIAAEWPIYGRYGFGAATEHVTYDIDARAARFPPNGGGEGEIAYVTKAEARGLMPAVFDAHRLRSPGELTRTGFRWDVDFGVVPPAWPEDTSNGPTHHVVCRDGGEVTGYAIYQVRDEAADRVTDGVITLGELIAATPGAYTRLWRFLCEHDLIVRIHAENRPAHEPVRWQLVDGRALRERMRADFLWVRLLDVERALEARSYPVPGRVVLEVSDPMGYADGRFVLDAGPDGARCARTDASPDIALDAAALGSLYLGGFGARELALGGLVTECATGAIDRADVLFHSTVPPFSATWF